MIDWQFLFLAWELKGKFPAILEQPVARELYDDANVLLDAIIADGSFEARGVYGFWPAHSDGDDIVLDNGGCACRCCASRPQKPTGRANRSLADYVAPSGDHLGGFALGIHGADALAARYEAEHDDYRAIMVKALADRLAEAFAEYLHLEARREWFEPDAEPGWKTCTPSGSAASGPRSATRPAPTTARRKTCSSCWAPTRSGWGSPSRTR